MLSSRSMYGRQNVPILKGKAQSFPVNSLTLGLGVGEEGAGHNVN